MTLYDLPYLCKVLLRNIGVLLCLPKPITSTTSRYHSKKAWEAFAVAHPVAQNRISQSGNGCVHCCNSSLLQLLPLPFRLQPKRSAWRIKGNLTTVWEPRVSIHLPTPLDPKALNPTYHSSFHLPSLIHIFNHRVS